MKHFSMLLSHLGLGGSMSNMEKASFEIALKGKRQIANETYEFIFEKPKNFHFNAGQHVRMTLLDPSIIDDKGNSRFMTLANTPKEKDLVIAMRMSNSAFKKVLGKMEIGEKVLIQILLHSPHGSFVLHDNPTKPAVFLVGGIGIVPAYSMIKNALEKKLKHKMFLFFSNRHPEDAPFLIELQKLAKQNSNFKLIATMTKSTKLWKGETGYINKSMLKRYIKELQSPIYYIVGLIDMVNAMKTLLKGIQVNEDNIRSEDFSGMKMTIMNLSGNTKGNKNHLLFIGIGLLLLLVFIAHVGAFSSIHNVFSSQNLFYATMGFAFLIVLKILVISKFKHNLKKAGERHE